MKTDAAKIISFLIMLLSALSPSKINAERINAPAIDGNWSSGGGEILEQAQNPWFLEGIPSAAPVKYCIARADDFPVAMPDLERLVTASLSWWNDQFGNAHSPKNVIYSDKAVSFTVTVNTSRFVKENCGPSTELAFQFGYLSPIQAREFQRRQIDLKRYIGLSIRTAYGADLRAKGFIYISPDRGPMAFKGENILAESWTSGDPSFIRLSSALTHELGHVFGLTHGGPDESIMNARFPESLVRPHPIDTENSIASLVEGKGIKGAVFFHKLGEVFDTYDRDYCGEFEKAVAFREFFEIPSEMKCFKLRLTLNSLILDASPDSSYPRQWYRIGSASFKQRGKRRYRELVTVWLPRNQTAFKGISNMSLDFPLHGPSAVEIQNSALFEFAASPKAKLIFIEASPEYLQIGGASDKGLIPDLLPVGPKGQSLSGWTANE